MRQRGGEVGDVGAFGMNDARGATARRAVARSVRRAWEVAPNPVVVADRGGVVVGLNEAARRLIGADAVGRPLSDTAPRWLAEAHRSAVTPEAPTADEPVAGRIGGRVVRAYPLPGADAAVVWWLVDHTDRCAAEDALREERRRTAILSEVSSALLSSLNVERSLDVTARMAASHLADAAVVISPSRGRRHRIAYARRGGAVVHANLAVRVGDVSGLAEALRGFPPVPARWIDPDTLPEWIVPRGFCGSVGSVIVAPLPGHGVPAGALVLLRSQTRQAFSDGEEDFARLFAARAGAALSAARLHAEQSEVTSTLMRELLPPRLDRVGGVEFAGAYRAAEAAEQVGGDFYEVHPAVGPGGETLLVLGDVAGKGLDAAVVTGMIRTTLRALRPLAGDHAQVLRLLNDALLTSRYDRFATLVLASVRREDHRVRLRLTSAGHPAPLVVRRTGAVEAVPTGGMAVGAFPGITVRTVDAALEPGDTCLLYTDGVTEARGGPFGDEFYGERRLVKALAECGGLPAEALVERVQMLVSEWLGPAEHDDIATVAVGAPPSASQAATGGPEGGAGDGEGQTR